MVHEMIETKNWKGIRKHIYKEQIIKDVECRSYNKLKILVWDKKKQITVVLN